MEQTIADFISMYDGKVAGRLLHYHHLLLRHYPELQIVVDGPARLLAYGYGTGYKDSICTLMPAAKGLKIGFYKGVTLPDPYGLLTGKGKVHRHVVVTDDLDEASLLTLLKAAHDAYESRKASY